MPIGSSYPLDDVCGALPSAAEHTALKEAFFQLKRKSSTSSDPTPFQPPPPPQPGCRTPAPSCPASPGCSPSASCGSTGAGWRWTPVLRRHLFSSGMRVCWCWQGGAHGWRGSVYGVGGGTGPLGEKEIKEVENFHTASFP